MPNPRPLTLPLYRSAPEHVSPLAAPARVAAKLLLAAGYGMLAVLVPPSSLFILALPPAVMLLIVLWLLPDRATYPFGAIEALYKPFFILLMIWPAYIAMNLPGLPWITPTRALLFVLVFLLLYSLATSAALRRHLLVVAKSSPGIWIAFLAWVVTQLITVPLSRAPADSLKAFFDNQLRLTSMMFIGIMLFSRRGRATWTIGALVVTALITSVDGFVELRLGYPPWSNYIPSFLSIDPSLLSNVLGSQARSADGLYRVRAFFTISLLCAEFLALCVPFMLHWLFTGRTLALRLSMSVLIPLTTAAILITQSRLGLVGLLVALGLYPSIWAYRRWRNDRTSLVAASILFGYPAIIGAMIMVIASSNTLTTRVMGGGAQAASTESRKTQMRLGLPKIARNPVGYGLRQSGNVLGFLNPAGFGTIDNGYLSTALDIGVVGFVGFFGMFLIGARNGVVIALRTDDRENALAGPLAVTFVAFVVMKSVLSLENSNAFLFLLLGMMLALKAREYGVVGADGTLTEPGDTEPAFLPPAVPAGSGYPQLARRLGE